jgi:hypothetical protein
VSEAVSPIDEMYLEGLALKRAQLRRQHPSLADEAIEHLLLDWIANRPMDAPGRVRLA